MQTINVWLSKFQTNKSIQKNCTWRTASAEFSDFPGRFNSIIIIYLNNNNNNIKDKKVNRFYKSNEALWIREGIIKSGLRIKENEIKKSVLYKRGSY